MTRRITSHIITDMASEVRNSQCVSANNTISYAVSGVFNGVLKWAISCLAIHAFTKREPCRPMFSYFFLRPWLIFPKANLKGAWSNPSKYAMHISELI